ncbi:MAG TPA: YetF domain-containing protein [Candidatus Binatia bacterium]|nr:YetF domain-containing protein [Candidatus Binatia bacterium]
MHPGLWSDMFQLGVPIAEKVLRATIVYFVLVALVRVAGKRELAQLNPFDLVVLLTLSNTVQNAIIGNDNSVTGGLVGAATLIGVNYLVVRVLYGHERLEQLIEGAPDVLVEDGHVRVERLRKELITLSELETAAHKQGFASLEEVDRAVLEPGGTIAFFARKPSPDVTRHEELRTRLDEILRELHALRPRAAD